jgi:hypothetical protein
VADSIKGSDLPKPIGSTINPLVDTAFAIIGGVTEIVLLRDLVNWSIYDAGRNLKLGPYAASINETGIDNIAIGNGALESAITASSVIAIGTDAAKNVGAAIDVIAIGKEALKNCLSDTNLAVGNIALRANTHGQFNLALGHWTLSNNITGNFNCAVGNNAASSLTSGSSVTALGAWSAQSVTTQSSVTAVGHDALRDCEQSYCTAVGTGALKVFVSSVDGANDAIGASSQENTTGGGNCSFGSFSLQNNTTGKRNLAGGGSAMRNNIDGEDNVAWGYGSLSSAEHPYQNVVVGSLALRDAIDNGVDKETRRNVVFGANACLMAEFGSNNIVMGSNAAHRYLNPESIVAVGAGALLWHMGVENCVMGSYAMKGTEFPYPTEAVPNPTNPNTGGYNTAFGTYSASNLETGIGNSVFGNLSGSSLLSGSNNTALGRKSLKLATSGSDNVAIGSSAGAYAQVSSHNTWNEIVLGASATGKGPQTATIGDPSTKAVSLGGAVTVSQLPSAMLMGAGARSFVTDANSTTFLSPAIGGGSNKVPVVSDGAIWLIG